MHELEAEIASSDSPGTRCVHENKAFAWLPELPRTHRRD